MNVDYEFYRSRYHGGPIPESEWPNYEFRSETQLNRYKRIYTVTVPDYNPDAESMAICAMADALYSFDLIANGEGGVQSASVGSVSTSYGSQQAVDISPAGQSRELYKCASLYLNIYRGVG